MLEELGAYEISDRDAPTFRNTITQTTPDRIMVIPSGEWDPMTSHDMKSHPETFPTDVIWEDKISDHAALLLTVPTPPQENQDHWVTVLESLDEEDWQAIDHHFAQKTPSEIQSNADAEKDYKNLIMDLKTIITPYQKKIKIKYVN